MLLIRTNTKFEKPIDVRYNLEAQLWTVGGSAYLYLKDKNDTKTLEQVKKILNDLPEDQKKYFRITFHKYYHLTVRISCSTHNYSRSLQINRFW
jgi:hypothetical protein